ncbi:MAG: response regulator transcription factor [Actinobacteria bacterium]|nr:response regulator transcription factor [Actinomycetota bacterium]
MEGSKNIRLLVAEDHAGVRQALVKMIGLQGDMEVVGEAADGQEAVRLALTLSPDVVLLDVRMPGMDGVRVIQELRRSGCTARIIVLSAHEDESYISDAVKSGADSYLLKGMSMRAVIDAVRSVVGGTTVLPPGVAEPLARKYREQDETIKAFQGLLEAGTRRGALLGEACRFFKEILDADEAAVFALEGEDREARYELLVSCREGGSSEGPSADSLFNPPLSAYELRSLARIAEGERLVVCNSLREPEEEGEAISSLNVIAVPLRPRIGEIYMVTCLRKSPFNPHPSVIRHAELLASQVAFMLEACRHADMAASHGKRVKALEGAVAELLCFVASDGNHAEFLEKAALLLEANAVFVAWTRGGAQGEPEFLAWGLEEEEARAALWEIEPMKTVSAIGVMGLKGATIAMPFSSMSSAAAHDGSQSVLVLPLSVSSRVASSNSRREGDGGIVNGSEEGQALPATGRHGIAHDLSFPWEAVPSRPAWGVLCAIGDYHGDYLEGKEDLLDYLASCMVLLLSSLDPLNTRKQQYNTW